MSSDPARVARMLRAGLSPLAPSLSWWAGAAALAGTLPWCAARLLDTMRASLLLAADVARGHAMPAPRDTLDDTLRAMLTTLAAPLCAALVASTVVTLAQTGARVHAAPRRTPAHPLDAVAAMVCLGGASVAAARVWAAHAYRVGSPHALVDAVTHAGVAVLVVAGVAAVIELAARRAQWSEALHPPPDEARREAREADGDPAVKSRRRALWP